MRVACKFLEMMTIRIPFKRRAAEKASKSSGGLFDDRRFLSVLADPLKFSDADDPEKQGPIPAEADSDNVTNVGNAVYTVNYIFKGGPAPCCP
jgi:hypothetical protein